MLGNSYRIRKRLLPIIFMGIFLVNCSTVSNREYHQKLIGSVERGDYEKAIDIAKDEKFYPDKNSILLKKLETATVYYLSGDYYQALKNFEDAQKISDDLYTKRISKKIAAALTDENADNYYGEKYEQSLIRFYLSLTHYNLYQTGKYNSYTIYFENGEKEDVAEKILSDREKRAHLTAARSIIIEWDSLLNSYKEETAGESVYKLDLVAKLWGAFIHETYDTLTDNQIALQLYKDAKDVLFKYYNVYPTFNKKYKVFNENFSNLYRMNIDTIKDKYIDDTFFAVDLKRYLDEKIKKLSTRNKDNFTIVLKDGFISHKEAKIVTVPIPLFLFTDYGDDNLLSFASSVMTINSRGLPMISFEVPEIKQKNIDTKYSAVIYDDNNNKLKEIPIILLNPMSDIAYKSIDDRIAGVYATTVAKVAARHIAALASAYAIYKSDDSPFTRIMAIASYSAAAKAIFETTRADLRQWQTLAGNIRMGSTNLKFGKYKIKIIPVVGGIERSSVYDCEFVMGRRETLLDINL